MNVTSTEAAAKSSNVGRFIWYELSTPDLEASKAFYSAALGWGGDAFEGGMPYWIWKAGDEGIGGAYQETAERPHWKAYIYAADVDATLARAADLGGRIVTPGTDIPGVGRFGFIADPQGATVALLSPTGEDRPHDMRKIGNVGWHELHTTDSENALTFYSALFGWKPAQEMDMGEMGKYRIFRHPADAEEAQLGGMFDMAKHMGTPPTWLYYVNVDGVDGALERINGAGGKVVSGPMDVPGGRAAVCQDPHGGYFAIFGEEPKAG